MGLFGFSARRWPVPFFLRQHIADVLGPARLVLVSVQQFRPAGYPQFRVCQRHPVLWLGAHQVPAAHILFRVRYPPHLPDQVGRYGSVVPWADRGDQSTPPIPAHFSANASLASAGTTR